MIDLIAAHGVIVDAILEGAKYHTMTEIVYITLSSILYPSFNCNVPLSQGIQPCGVPPSRWEVRSSIVTTVPPLFESCVCLRMYRTHLRAPSSARHALLNAIQFGSLAELRRMPRPSDRRASETKTRGKRESLIATRAPSYQPPKLSVVRRKQQE